MLLAVRLAQRRCVLDHLVELGRDQEYDAAQPEPAHEHHDAGERAVGGAVVAPVLDVEAKQQGSRTGAPACRAGCRA